MSEKRATKRGKTLSNSFTHEQIHVARALLRCVSSGLDYRHLIYRKGFGQLLKKFDRMQSIALGEIVPAKNPRKTVKS